MIVSITIGHNVGDEPTYTHAQVVEHAADILALSGATCYECTGIWQGHIEESTRVDVACTLSEAKRIHEAIPCLARALKQEAIGFAVTRQNMEFVPAANINEKEA